jgi:hypothetical protein
MSCLKEDESKLVAEGLEQLLYQLSDISKDPEGQTSKIYHLLATKKEQPILLGKDSVRTLASIAHNVLICETIEHRSD